MAVTAALIKELRELTGAGMSDCKKALTETDGNIEKAIEFLREKGLAAAAKKAGRVATEGLCAVKEFANGDCALVEVNSETDFVAKNQEFITYVDEVLDQVGASSNTEVEAFLTETWNKDNSVTVAEALSQKIAVIGENLTIRRFAKLEKAAGTNFVSYIHGGGKVAVVVELVSESVSDALVECGKNVCMQIAAMSPQFVNSTEIPADFVEKETEILRQVVLNEGKPENMVDKIVAGKLDKQLKGFCLLNQEYVKGDKETVADYLANVSKELGFTVDVKRFVRFETGEGLEKKEENFAEEVAKTMQG